MIGGTHLVVEYADRLLKENALFSATISRRILSHAIAFYRITSY